MAQSQAQKATWRQTSRVRRNPAPRYLFASGHPLTADPNRANYGGLALGGLPIFIRTLPRFDSRRRSRRDQRQPKSSRRRRRWTSTPAPPTWTTNRVGGHRTFEWDTLVTHASAHAGVCSQKCSAVFNEEPVNRWALWQSDFIWAKCDLTHKAPMPFECGGGGGPMAVTGLGHDSHYYVNAGGHA